MNKERAGYMTLNTVFGIFFGINRHDDHIPEQQSRISVEMHKQTS
jgi:hypothetical protein